jgi:hypothetical protein
MQTTTPTISALESIDFALLDHVSGGCGKKHCCPCPAPAAPVQQTQIIQLPQAAAPVALPPAPSGDSVSTNVSINGQPAS